MRPSPPTGRPSKRARHQRRRSACRSMVEHECCMASPLRLESPLRHAWPCSRHRCGARGCSCPAFFIIVAEGAWVLCCRCKHKHTEHEPGGRHACAKAGCACAAFDSPWVCNCNHPWAQHVQRVVEKQVGSRGPTAGPCGLLLGPQPNRTVSRTHHHHPHHALRAAAAGAHSTGAGRAGPQQRRGQRSAGAGGGGGCGQRSQQGGPDRTRRSGTLGHV